MARRRLQVSADPEPVRRCAAKLWSNSLFTILCQPIPNQPGGAPHNHSMHQASHHVCQPIPNQLGGAPQHQPFGCGLSGRVSADPEPVRRCAIDLSRKLDVIEEVSADPEPVRRCADRSSNALRESHLRRTPREAPQRNHRTHREAAVPLRATPQISIGKDPCERPAVLPRRRTARGQSWSLDRPSRVRAAAGGASPPSCRVPIGPRAVRPARLDTHTRRLRGNQPPYRSLAGWPLPQPYSTITKVTPSGSRIQGWIIRRAPRRCPNHAFSATAAGVSPPSPPSRRRALLATSAASPGSNSRQPGLP